MQDVQVTGLQAGELFNELLKEWTNCIYGLRYAIIAILHPGSNPGVILGHLSTVIYI